MFSAHWLAQAAHTAVQMACFGIWIAGCVIALRQRPRAGATSCATGFGLLSLVQLYLLVTYLTFLVRVQFGGASSVWPDSLAMLIGGLAGLAQIAGAAFVVAGVSWAWSRRSEDQPDPARFHDEMHGSLSSRSSH